MARYVHRYGRVSRVRHGGHHGEDHYTFKACNGTRVKADGKEGACNYVTMDMTEDYCPRCGSKLTMEY